MLVILLLWPPDWPDGKLGPAFASVERPSPMHRLDTRPESTFPDLPSFAPYAVGSPLVFAAAIVVPSYSPTASRELLLLLKATSDVAPPNPANSLPVDTTAHVSRRVDQNSCSGTGIGPVAKVLTK
jgi:hypothetical protein